MYNFLKWHFIDWLQYILGWADVCQLIWYCVICHWPEYCPAPSNVLWVNIHWRVAHLIWLERPFSSCTGESMSIETSFCVVWEMNSKFHCPLDRPINWRTAEFFSTETVLPFVLSFCFMLNHNAVQFDVLAMIRPRNGLLRHHLMKDNPVSPFDESMADPAHADASEFHHDYTAAGATSKGGASSSIVEL